MLGSIPGEDSKLFLCLTLVTRQSNLFPFPFLMPICHSCSRNSTPQNFMKLKFMKFLLLLWPLRFPTLLIHDDINAGNLIFPEI